MVAFVGLRFCLSTRPSIHSVVVVCFVILVVVVDVSLAWFSWFCILLHKEPAVLVFNKKLLSIAKKLLSIGECVSKQISNRKTNEKQFKIYEQIWVWVQKVMKLIWNGRWQTRGKNFMRWYCLMKTFHLLVTACLPAFGLLNSS